jgi:hypothetical protein
MRLERDQLNYFEEVGRVYRVANEFKQHGVEVHFEEKGYRISERFKKQVRTEYFETSRELRMYLNGLQDGFYSAKEGQADTFGVVFDKSKGKK